MPLRFGIAMSMMTTSGSKFLGHADRFASFSRFADHFEIVVLFQLQAQTLSHDAVIVRDQYADLFHARTPAGSSTLNRRAPCFVAM